MSGYLDFIKEQLAPLGKITARAMFGGYCVYCDGTVFAIIAEDTLYLKADDVNRPDFDAAGLKAFKPFDDKPMVMQYYLAPPEVFEDPEALEKWVGGAVQAGRRGKKKPKKKKQKRPRQSRASA